MVKTIFKEICIMLLLCVAIVLILGVIFYDSIPSNKAVPNKLTAYTTPDNVQAEIEEKVVGMDKVEVSYEVTSSDLTLYKQTHSYTAGKVDPFADLTDTANATTEGGSTVINGTSSGTSSSGSTTTDPNSTGTFFNNTGK